ncbi:MAG: EAL domain-containing protein [Legionellaceae bacterium]|nr:EAL domain-containing protein [Legionellaceae bacterium]
MIKKKSTSPDAEEIRRKAEEKLSKQSSLETDKNKLHELTIYQIELEMQNQELQKLHVESDNLLEKYTELYDFAPIPYLLIDNNTTILNANKAAEKILKNNCHSLSSLRLGVFVSDDSRTFFNTSIDKAFKSKIKTEFEVSFLIKKELYTFLLSTIVDKSNKNLLIAAQDITNRKKMEENIRISAIVFESQEAMVITDADQIILRVNQSFTKITGFGEKEAIGKKPTMLSSGEQHKSFYKDIWDNISSLGSWSGEIKERRKNGEIFIAYLIITSVKNKDGSICNFVASFSDMTSSIVASKKIMKLGFYDFLTGLPNRRLFMNRFNHSLEVYKRRHQYGALLFIDLDNFKNLNDTLGHDIGDLLLKQVASRLKYCTRGRDTVARIGGDEFMVILEDLSEKKDAAAMQSLLIVQRILKKLSQVYSLTTHQYYNSASIGIVMFNDQDLTLKELIKRADIAMYNAKNTGRNKFVFFEQEMQEVINCHVQTENDLRLALENKELELYYQTQVDQSGEIIGVEALIRWNHPKTGIVLPYAFIPLAEDTDLILMIGEQVLDMACSQIKAWKKDPMTCNLNLSINVSVKQFENKDFVKQVQSAIQRHAINPALLKIELTESMLIKNFKTVHKTMSTLCKMGLRFDLDDFGTGYSSLQYLKLLPLCQIKIDLSFVKDIVTDSNDQAISHTIIMMAKNLGLEVIAEGVETKEQQKVLLEIGCQRYQGYLYGKPLPIKEFEELIHRSMR